MVKACFQSFEDRTDRAATRPRLEALRAELSRRGLDGFVVPHTDRYQSEYLPPSEERLAWLTGFTGSAGAAIILADRAAIFVDGRYTLQAAEQVDTACITIQHITESAPDAWLESNLSPGA
ncbi:MAG: aminopeptidase P family N-terminal domain-containing protein, partial [Bradyrhizobiaceae bacterium]|nr:aminopeptidase P family N-terminal domain-containing protein [Bradyrhizobiaceae bacterium]